MMHELYDKLMAEAESCVDRVREPRHAEADYESLVRKNEAAAALSLVQAAMTLRRASEGRR